MTDDNCDCKECDCDDGCECGEEHDVWYAVTMTAGILILGILELFMGTYNLNASYNFWNMGFDSYSVAKLVIALVVIAIGWYGISNGIVPEGLVMLLFGTSSAAFSLSAAMGGLVGLDYLDVFIGIGLLVVCVAFVIRKEILMTLATVVIALGSIIYPFLTGDAYNILFGVTAIVSGAIFVYLALSQVIYEETGEDILPLY
jgi:hypothetical protein